MICQFCGKHEANKVFLVNYMGQENEVFICDECLKNFQSHAGIPGKQHMATLEKREIWPSWPIGFKTSEENLNPTESLDKDAGIELRMKRKLNQLYRQLKHAVDAERYEDAAILNDKINTIKSEVFINGK